MTTAVKLQDILLRVRELETDLEDGNSYDASLVNQVSQARVSLRNALAMASRSESEQTAREEDRKRFQGQLSAMGK